MVVICLSSRAQELTLAVWHIALAPFAQVILTLCCPSHTLRPSPSCCINIGHCPPLSIKMLLIVNENQLRSEYMG